LDFISPTNRLATVETIVGVIVYERAMHATELASLVLVGALWGCTNSFLKQEEEDHADIRNEARQQKRGEQGEKGLLSHLVKLLCNWRFIVPFLLNQSGSLLYYLLLGSTQLSLAVPICNATTFVFTLLTARFVRGEEQTGNPWLLACGVTCIVIGVGLMSLPEQEIVEAISKKSSALST